MSRRHWLTAAFLIAGIAPKAEAQYSGKERRRLDWPFKPLSAAEREDGIAPATTPGPADAEASSPGREKKT